MEDPLSALGSPVLMLEPTGSRGGERGPEGAVALPHLRGFHTLKLQKRSWFFDGSDAAENRDLPGVCRTNRS